MRKLLLTTAGIFFMFAVCFAQTREELEKQRKQLKAEIDQAQKILDETRNKTKVSIGDLTVVNHKMNIQERLIDNINRDLNNISNDIYKSQREINKLNLILDTLRQEYAKSMVYAYKNRSNYNFLNFIFSARSFNDAIRRVAYLKSYRTYRELQGENILRTQDLLKQRIDEMNGNKQKKNVALQGQSKEMDELEKQQDEKQQIVNKLKAQGKELANQISARKKQMQKVTNAINIAIKKAQDEAIAAEKARLKKLADDAAKAATSSTVKTTVKPDKPKATPKEGVSVLLNAENRALNEKFEINRGSLPWPVDKGYVMMHYGPNDLPDGGKLINPGVTIGTSVGSPVKSIFAGTVSKILYIDNMQVVIIQHGRYFSSYSNLSSVSVQSGQAVTTGQVLGKAGANDDGVGSIDLLVSSERGEDNPERWIHK